MAMIAVVQLTKEGEFLKSYPSIKTAARETGVNIVNINHCIHRYRNFKSAGGFIWRMEEEYNIEQTVGEEMTQHDYRVMERRRR